MDIDSTRSKIQVTSENFTYVNLTFDYFFLTRTTLFCK